MPNLFVSNCHSLLPTITKAENGSSEFDYDWIGIGHYWSHNYTLPLKPFRQLTILRDTCNENE